MINFKKMAELENSHYDMEIQISEVRRETEAVIRADHPDLVTAFEKLVASSALFFFMDLSRTAGYEVFFTDSERSVSVFSELVNEYVSVNTYLVNTTMENRIDAIRAEVSHTWSHFKNDPESKISDLRNKIFEIEESIYGGQEIDYNETGDYAGMIIQSRRVLKDALEKESHSENTNHFRVRLLTSLVELNSALNPFGGMGLMEIDVVKFSKILIEDFAKNDNDDVSEFYDLLKTAYQSED